ncbi:hypothetical protein LOTGIDRAFT_163501 [Lottia gigantea]|uniref:Uncharacterized protein n=1 Tax=Lottia gigantea TaxID=225164 RepID=V4A7J4_LOTGI|nr:hypothetical protein LOTGIDRAFT_163501 [Lottia gigantea]ESO90990.1 hypothetical protein LOTGIDRAFT_163501 [Lottia gigantea]
MSQSVFHVNHNESTLVNEVQNSYDAITAYNMFSFQYDGAGSRLIQTLSQALKGTVYQQISEECWTCFTEIYSARQTLKFIEHYKAMERELFNLKKQIDSGNQQDLSKLYSQTFFHILLQFIKMQDDYFKLCHENISNIISKLMKTSEEATTSPTEQPAQSSPSKQKSNVSSTNSSPKLTKHQTSPPKQQQPTLKSSFLSLFERKSVPREKQSAFYVDVQDDSNEKGNPRQQMPTITCDDISAQSHISNGTTSSSSTKNLVDIASDEEIDSVINLLSCLTPTNPGNNSNTMSVIPENHIQLTVPQIYRMPSPLSDTNIDELKPPNFVVHRRSEGSLDLSAIQKNIWNSPHRGSLPGGGLRQFGGDISAINRRYSQDMYHSFRGSSPYVPSVGWPGTHWLTPTSNLHTNNTWPYYNALNHGQTDTLNSSWSGVQDSSDLSDDSSCGGGEQFFAVGQDLVQALDSKDYDSDDENKTKGDKRNIKKCSNTWPVLQQWDKTNTDHNNMLQPPSDEDHMIHRPVQMQWSDPMSSHSMWPSNPPGVQQQRHSQSMQGFSLYQ